MREFGTVEAVSGFGNDLRWETIDFFTVFFIVCHSVPIWTAFAISVY